MKEIKIADETRVIVENYLKKVQLKSRRSSRISDSENGKKIKKIIDAIREIQEEIATLQEIEFGKEKSERSRHRRLAHAHLALEKAKVYLSPE